jgi:hypothetical protein
LVLSLLICVAPASAHVFVAPTNLTIHAKGSTVSGMLVGRPECRGGQTIVLVVDGHVIDSTTTDTRGRYAFSYTLQPPSTVQTRFGGSHTGAHPHRHICRPSASRLVKTTAVRGASGTRNNTGGTDQSDTAAFTGTDVRVPLTLAIVGLILGASLLLLARRGHQRGAEHSSEVR